MCRLSVLFSLFSVIIAGCRIFFSIINGEWYVWYIFGKLDIFEDGSIRKIRALMLYKYHGNLKRIPH